MDWLSYSIVDFVPITEAVYQRLSVRVNQHWWPWPPIAGLFAVLALLLHFRFKASGPSNAMIGLLWGCLGYGYFTVFYQPLIWVGGWFALACGIQLSMFWLTACCAPNSAPITSGPVYWCGVILSGLGLAWPLFGLMFSWEHAEWLGLHPDPTAVFTLGWVLLVSSSWRTWILALVPLLWLSWSALIKASFYLTN